MPTFGELEFASDEDNDSDAVELTDDSDDTATDESEVEGDESKRRRRQQQQQRAIKEKQKRFAAFVSHSLKQPIAMDRPHVIRSDGFFREFTKPQPKSTTPKNETPEELFDYLQRCAGSKKPEEPLRIRPCKKALFAAPDSRAVQPSGAVIASAVEAGGIPQSEQVVNLMVAYAGQTYGVQKRVHRDSRKYRKYVRDSTGANNLGGVFSKLDTAVAGLKEPPKISSVEKSRLDWDEFKRTNLGVEAELTGTEKDGYIARQTFLSSAHWRQEQAATSRGARRQ